MRARWRAIREPQFNAMRRVFLSQKHAGGDIHSHSRSLKTVPRDEAWLPGFDGRDQLGGIAANGYEEPGGDHRNQYRRYRRASDVLHQPSQLLVLGHWRILKMTPDRACNGPQAAARTPPSDSVNNWLGFRGVTGQKQDGRRRKIA